MMKSFLNLCCFSSCTKEKRTPSVNNLHLPMEIMENIFLRLPIKSLLRFKCMCKTWCSIIGNPHFSHMYFPSSASQIDNPSAFILFPLHFEADPYLIEDHSEGDPILIEDHDEDNVEMSKEARITEPFKLNLPFLSNNTSVYLAGSSNGILCLSSFHSRCRSIELHFPNPSYISNPIQSNYSVSIWNPSTREHVKLPHLTLPNCDFLAISSGFAFNPSSKEFQVVQLFDYLDYAGKSRSEIQIYTKGWSSWRKIGGDSLSLFHRSTIPNIFKFLTRGSPVFLNGLFHWLTFSLYDGRIYIVSFNTLWEKFEDFPCPKSSPCTCNNTIKCSPFQLGVLGGCLSLSDSSAYHRHEIWVMKNYNVEESWTKQFVLTHDFIPRIHVKVIHPVSFCGNAEVVLLCDFNRLVSYNWETGKCRPLEDGKLPTYDFKATPYVNNLISLKSVCRI